MQIQIFIINCTASIKLTYICQQIRDVSPTFLLTTASLAGSDLHLQLSFTSLPISAEQRNTADTVSEEHRNGPLTAGNRNTSIIHPWLTVST